MQMFGNEIDKMLNVLDNPRVQKKIIQIVKKNIDVSVSSVVLPDEKRQDTPCENGEKVIGWDEYQKVLNEKNTLFEKNLELDRENKKLQREKQDSVNKAQLKERECRQYEEEVQEYKRKLETAQEDVKKYKKDVQDTKGVLTSTQKELQDLKSQFSEVLSIYQKFCSVSETTMDSLINVLTKESVIGFLVKGVQWENINGLGEFIECNLDSGKISEEEMAILNEVYDKLFQLYCLTDESCHRLETTVGEVFDSDYQVRGSGSKDVSGAIEKVLFEGYRKGNHIIKKSIVWIKA